MSYKLNKTDGSLLVDLVDGQLDTTSSDLTLIGRNYSGFGEVLNEINTFPNLPILLVNPLKKVSTQTVFSMLKNKKNPPLSKVTVLIPTFFALSAINFPTIAACSILVPLATDEEAQASVLPAISSINCA